MKICYRFILIFLSFIIYPFLSYSNENYSKGFYENRGQWGKDFLYKYTNGNSTLFINKHGHVISTLDNSALAKFKNFLHGQTNKESTSVILNGHAIQRKFINSSEENIWRTENFQKTVSSFSQDSLIKDFDNLPRGYHSIIQEGIYDGVNIKYYFQNNKVKYDLIIAPFTNPNQIKFKYEGADSIYLQSQTLIITTSIGELNEEKPYAYQLIDNQIIEVECQYSISNNVVSFNIGEYNHSYELIIDPILYFGTYSGSSADNWGFCAAPGPDGSLYAAGIVFGQGYPTTLGAFQTTIQGQSSQVDIAISKYSPNGKELIFSTLLGGINEDVPISMTVDKNGDLVILGRTNSGLSFPHLKSFGSLGGYDIFVFRLSSDGKRLKNSVLIGGVKDDGANIDYSITSQGSRIIFNPEQLLNYAYGDNNRGDIVIDGNNNIVIVSQTNSLDFPIFNAFQTSFNGIQDCVITKFTPTLDTIMFSTFFGGNSTDAAFSVALNSLNEIIIAGNTNSNLLPGTLGNLIFKEKIGSIDGFLTMLNSEGKLLRTTFIGTNSLDLIYNVQVDKNDFIYISAITLGSWPVVNAAYVVSGSKQVIAKVNPDLTDFVYATTYGRASNLPNIIPASFWVDSRENVFVSGWGGEIYCGNYSHTSGTLGLPITTDRIQGTTDGNDYYFFVLERNAQSQLYGSFFGQTGGVGDHVDGGKSRFDSTGTLYLAICSCRNMACGTMGKGLPITSQVPGPAIRSSNCNMYSARIQFYKSDLVTSVLNVDRNSNIKFFPNPVKKELNIEGLSDQSNKLIFSVYDQLGKLVYSVQNRLIKKLNLEHLPQGLYILRINNEKGSLIRETKILKQ